MADTSGRGRALVVGLGIAGLATALRLRRVGWEPVLIERAPERRSSGYFVMLFGTGVTSARRLDVLEAIGNRSSPALASYEVDRAGRRTPGLSPAGLPGKPRVLMRGDIEQALFSELPDDVEIRYATVPTQITQDDSGAEVTLRNTASGDTVTERFDLVVGADGMRSTVRELVFGPQRYLHPLNYMIGATVADGPVEGFGLNDGVVLAEPGRSVWAFAFRDHGPGLLFSYRTNDIDAEFGQPAIESIRAAFGPQRPGRLLENLFTAFDNAPEHLFDSVNQVRMPRWHRGRVVLVGDSAWCLTLYSGMGASSAIAGGELLGTLLRRHSADIPGALRAWEARMRPFIHKEQSGVLAMRTLFTPHDRREQFRRTLMIRLMRNRVTGPAMGRIIDMSNKEFDVAAV
ncbi:FAD-dependent oxidoreductase [Spongiactinospora gelatinilytica]|uniref:FAD-dependent oxidoreductase n=1 Tax=Spongiactinospora gelatinilytica TaxID=2666298 RepID=A0A2W2FU42_9ACTN|nr:FAD-dependent monooxygenase [Spongiactinospora gelatinilytica]PZG32035.1 FAD-dependent oxidoreductase [Spongiactinospora gelatinilytica]